MDLESVLNALPRSIKVNKIEYKLIISTNLVIQEKWSVYMLRIQFALIYRSMNQLVMIYVLQPMICCNGARRINMSND